VHEGEVMMPVSNGKLAEAEINLEFNPKVK